MAGPCVNRRRCQATGKLLFSPYTGQLGAHIPSLLVRCHKPFIGRSVARLKQINTRPPSLPAHARPRKACKESGCGRGPESLGMLAARAERARLGRGSLLGARSRSWGLELIGTLCQTRIAEDACSADNTNSVALRVGGETEAREAASTSGQETPGRATSRLRTGVPPPRVQLGPRPALRAPSPCRCDGSGMRTPAWVVRAGAGTDSPGRARRRAAAAFSAADKVSLAPSGHRSGSRSGRSSPGRAAGGGRGCGRQGLSLIHI